MKHFLFIYHLFLIFCLHAGFDGSTFVKTNSGFSPIASLKKDNSVNAYDQTNEIQKGIISFTTKKSVLKAIRISCGETMLLVSPLQQFQLFESDEWIYAFQLKPNTKIKSMINAYEIVDSVEWIEGRFDLYDISVNKYHNFLVTNKELCVHNFPIAPAIVLGITVFAEGGFEFCCTIGLAAICGAVIGFIKDICHEELPKNLSYHYFDNRPEHEPHYFEESKEDREQRKEDWRPLTNKEARTIAEENGYRETKNHSIRNNHRKPVFYNKKTGLHITPDDAGHGGGSWKVFKDDERIGTYDEDLKTYIRH